MPVPYRHLTDRCYAATIGEGGLASADFAAMLARGRKALDDLRGAFADPAYDCLRAARNDDLAPLVELASSMRARFDDVLLVGIGGSGLGARALAAIAPPLGGGCTLHVLDNPQAGQLERLFATLSLPRTGVLLVSKSGSTAEVLAQALVVLPALAAQIGRAAIPEHVVAIAAPGETPLHGLAKAWGIRVLDHPPSVAGRYSVLTLVGLLPALLVGLDAAAVRRGAAAVLDDALTADRPAPLEGAVLMAALAAQGAPISVALSYDERLELFMRWYGQLWAESLGKEGRGMTPVAALGPIDQHSQLQLYLEGPSDKAFTVFLSEAQGAGLRIETAAIDGLDALSYLAGRTIGDLVAASARATVETLAARGRPVRVFALARVDEEAMGGLFMHFMIETILTARLLGVNPFDHAAVDEGKVRARDYLRTGRVALGT